ncbi:hypothetical protein EV426DRAFT_671855 [Tirmania nivea]|nr:hypothetical protein EV426DRAFT_671855 [Tirmania nivea]
MTMVLQNESAVVPASGDEYESGDKDLEDLNDLTHEVEPTNVIEKGKTAYGRDCVVVAGCGSGKFLSYQLLAGLKDESGIVVASLIALANQQAEYMKAHGVKAVAITGDNLTGDKNLWKEIEMGKYDMIFTSPELLFTRDSEEECEDLRTTPALAEYMAKATLRLYYFGKQTELEYSKLPEIEKAVVRHIVSVNFSAITLPRLCYSYQQRTFSDILTYIPHQGRNDQGLIPTGLLP